MPVLKGIKLLPLVFSFLLSSFLLAQNPHQQAHSDLVFDGNNVGAAGQASGNGLLIPKGDPFPPDYAPPVFSCFSFELGIRYPLFFDKERQVAFELESPLQLGLFNSSGPSLSTPSYSTSLWISVPAMVSMNQGLGAVWENADRNFGAYIGIGGAFNKALIRQKNYQFYVGSLQQETIPFRYIGYFTANAKTGVRWRNRRGEVRNLGFEGNYGIYGEWMVGIAFGTVLGM